ncbi:hypothetical protein EDB92DRAFT_1901556 [Lactarius akahatsu]|uniref:Mon2/Sec7/BIG1-like dimerisation and cyclophilin-binding domain-containing protein n=1 Tax=Lactarius akahatsu TaxID=416441 RepID=A0AAD4Q893_9AGAM|nr:hypothetical protein EDB92DRAFT_1901556 [Lactarius akahatsu]
MSSLSLLVTELQSLASETRRKHPEVREAAEKSLALLRSSPEQLTTNLASGTFPLSGHTMGNGLRVSSDRVNSTRLTPSCRNRRWSAC